MDHPVKRDHARFKKIIKGKVRDNLKKYVSGGEMPIQKGKEVFKVPMPQIETPRFKFGSKHLQCGYDRLVHNISML